MVVTLSKLTAKLIQSHGYVGVIDEHHVLLAYVYWQETYERYQVKFVVPSVKGDGPKAYCNTLRSVKEVILYSRKRG